nr:multiubiquitin domain-containing protein [Methylobacterium sp. L1A1]
MGNDGHNPHDRDDKGQDGTRKIKVYRFRIDKTEYESPLPDLTGRDLLVIAGKQHPERYKLLQKIGGAMKPVGLDEVVHVSDNGQERFITLPLDQTEGEQALPTRRDFTLPEGDRETLDATGLRWETVQEMGVARVVIRNYPVRPGYAPGRTDLMLRLLPGYPSSQIDMWYFHPPLARTDGAPIRALVGDVFEGKTWQGWSRHRTGLNPWRPDIDDIGTHLAVVEHNLAKEVGAA